MDTICREIKPEVKGLRLALVEEIKQPSFESATIDKKLELLGTIANQMMNARIPAETKIAIEQALLEIQYSVVISSTQNPLYLERILNRYNEIGYSSPIMWGMIRLELADLWQNVGRIKDAESLRKNVAKHYNELIDLIYTTVLKRVKISQ